MIIPLLPPTDQINYQLSLSAYKRFAQENRGGGPKSQSYAISIDHSNIYLDLVCKTCCQYLFCVFRIVTDEIVPEIT